MNSREARFDEDRFVPLSVIVKRSVAPFDHDTDVVPRSVCDRLGRPAHAASPRRVRSARSVEEDEVTGVELPNLDAAYISSS